MKVTIDKRPTITWTPAKRDLLRFAYERALAEKEDQFTFEGHALLVSYAKYLLEYLDGEFSRPNLPGARPARSEVPRGQL